MLVDERGHAWPLQEKVLSTKEFQRSKTKAMEPPIVRLQARTRSIIADLLKASASASASGKRDKNSGDTNRSEDFEDDSEEAQEGGKHRAKRNSAHVFKV